MWASFGVVVGSFWRRIIPGTDLLEGGTSAVAVWLEELGSGFSLGGGASIAVLSRFKFSNCYYW